VPLTSASTTVQLHPTGELVAAFTTRRQEVEQITAQVSETQGVVQLLLLSAQLIEQQLHLNKPVGEMADGDWGKALVVGAEGSTGSGWWGDAQGGQQCQGLGTTGGWFTGGSHGLRWCCWGRGYSGSSGTGGISCSGWGNWISHGGGGRECIR
jgi:hypothetical protein